MMKIIESLCAQSGRDTAVAIGFFDGVHRGHQAVIEKALDAKKDGLLGAVFSFTMRDAAPGKKRGAHLLQSLRQKRACLEALGTDLLVSPDFSTFRDLAPEAFAVDVLVKNLRAKLVCCGADYRFGRGASAGAGELRALLEPYGVRVLVVDPVLEGGEPISSTRIRSAVEKGDPELAERLLGRPFAVDFLVEHGRQLGRKLGFPTANQRFEPGFAAPRFGVYATTVLVEEKRYPAVTNVGVKPTVGSDGVCAESYLIGFEGDLYGKRIETAFLKRLRDEKKFSSLTELKEAIRENAEQALRLFCGQNGQ